MKEAAAQDVKMQGEGAQGAAQNNAAEEAREPVQPSPQPSRFVDDYLPYLLAQVSHRISAEFHREANQAGLSVTEWRVLASLEGSEGETIGALAELTLTKQPTLSKVVQRMEAEGLVQRFGVHTDRRQTRVRISPKGHALTDALRERAWQHQENVLEPFGRDRAALLIDMLKTLLALHPGAER
mgnify:CR=1 FL=1